MEHWKEVVQLKALQAKCWIKNKTEDTKRMVCDFGQWCSDNPVAAGTLGAIFVSGGKTIRSIVKAVEEDRRVNRKFYDPRTGFTTMAKRNVKGYERDEIERRYKAGESYNHIFADMGLRK